MNVKAEWNSRLHASDLVEMGELSDAIEVVDEIDECAMVVLGQLLDKLPAHSNPVGFDVRTPDVDEAVVGCRSQDRLGEITDVRLENTADAVDVREHFFV